MSLLSDGKYTITFPSSVDYLDKVESMTTAIGHEAGFDDSTIDDLSISVTELFNNAVHHGNKDDIHKLVTLTFQLNKKKLYISIKDQGRGFAPGSLKDPLAPENLLADSGRGIYLVKMLMDDMCFKISSSGSEIIISKSLPA